MLAKHESVGDVIGTSCKTCYSCSPEEIRHFFSVATVGNESTVALPTSEINVKCFPINIIK